MQEPEPASVQGSLEKACIICRNARHREITTCHGGDTRLPASSPGEASRGELPRHRRSPAVRRRPSVPGRNPCRHRPPARRCVKYVGCPLERTTPGGAKRARGKEFNSGRYYGDGGGDVVVSAVVLMTSGAPTAPVQYRRLTDVCPLPSPQQPAPYSASATL